MALPFLFIRGGIEMNFIIRETQPQNITINGVEYPAIWNFKAIALMEDFTGWMHLFTMARFKDGKFFEVKEFIGALYGMLSAAGVVCVDESGKDVLAAAIEQSIKPSDEVEIAKQVKKIIDLQGDQPKEGDSKNVKRSAKKI
jgi:hypothetical protein